MSRTFDVGVVGLGAVGSAAAYHAARRGLRVVGFDRHAPPHSFGSTHGGSRIIRRAYFEGSLYLPLLEEAYAQWRALEEASGAALLYLTGALTVGERGSRVLEGAATSARKASVAHEVLNPAEAMERFPAFRLRDNDLALFEPEAGWLHPEHSVHAHLDLARRHGAELHGNEPVEDWSADAAGVELRTASGSFSVGRLILCSGGWIQSSLSTLQLPLSLERQVNAWFRPSCNPQAFLPESCPVYIWTYDGDHVLYGFPDLGEGVKAGLHHFGRPAETPNDIDRSVHRADIDRLTETMSRILPDACGEVVHAATCFYTNTPDERFIIDAHPEHPNVFLASACSGHGFKFSSAVGATLASLAASEAPPVDLAPYRLDRF